MAQVFVTRDTPGRALDMLRDAGLEVIVWPGELPPPPEELQAHLRDSAAALTMVTDQVTPSMMDDAADLRVIANMAVGYDNVDPNEAAARGIWLTNTPGVLSETTADFAWSIMMAAARNVALSDRETRDGAWKTWSPTGYLGMDVYGATIGIIGLGEIGEAVARRARGFGMRVLYFSRTRKPEFESEQNLQYVGEISDLLEAADYVSLHVPLTSETRHMLGAAEFSHMKERSILVNTARGGVIDQDALVGALRDGRPGGAALDVTTPEPLPTDHPLFSFPQVVITPHIASASFVTRARMAEMAAENIITALRGDPPPHAVNRPEAPRGPRT